MMDRSLEEDGATMVEYGFLLVFIALVALAGVTTLGQSLLAFFQGAAGQL
jgi:Flp pilus assembly pilin Flp